MKNIICLIQFWEKYLIYEVQKEKRTKCWQVTLRFNCHMKFPIFREIFSYFQICYLRNTEWPLFSAKIVLIFMLMLHFVTLLFLFQFLVIIFFNILPDFSANIFFLLYHVCKQFILSFQTLQTIFVNISHTPSKK